MISKSRLKEQIENFPDEFTIDELIEKLILFEKVENGVKQSDNGEEISEEELDEEMVQINCTFQAKNDLKYISKDSVRYAQHQVSKARFRTQNIKKQIRARKVPTEINDPR